MIMSSQKEFAADLLRGRSMLQASKTQMAKHMRMDVARYEALESGAIVLPVIERKRLKRRVERLLELCGLKY